MTEVIRYKYIYIFNLLCFLSCLVVIVLFVSYNLVRARSTKRQTFQIHHAHETLPIVKIRRRLRIQLDRIQHHHYFFLIFCCYRFTHCYYKFFSFFIHFKLNFSLVDRLYLNFTSSLFFFHQN